MRRFQIAIVLLLVSLSLGSCSKACEPIIFKSDRTKIEITGTQIPFDPWIVNVSVSVDEKPLYELTQLEVYASDLNEESVHFNCGDGQCSITIDQMDGSVYTIPSMKLPVK